MTSPFNFSGKGESFSFITYLETQSQEMEKQSGNRAKWAVLRTYVENQAIQEHILLYHASKYKQTKEPNY